MKPVVARWAMGLFAVVVLAVSILVGSELPRASQLSFAVAAARPVKPVVVVLDRNGGRAFAGNDDPRTMRSGVIERNGYSYLDIPPFAVDDQEWNDLIDCVRSHYADFAVDISEQPPTRGDFVRVMIGGPSLDFGFDDTVHGIAPWNGRVQRRAVAFVFEPIDWEPETMCETTAHEIGHALGLDHSRNCADIMSYESCGPKAFVDEAQRCGEWEDRKCGNGRRKQNSYAELAGRVGKSNS